LSLWNNKAYKASVYQKVTGLENGTYTLSAWVKRRGKQKVCQLYAKSYNGNEMNAPLPISDTGWSKVTVSNIKVTNGQCEIGLYTEAGANDWCNIDHVMFRKVN
jgi:arabinogalactan endo-1,4-beta-galactosidase